MRCEETHELITALVDNELSHEERSSIEGHLKDCPRCRFVYGQEQTLKREVRMAGARVNVPADLKEKILSDRRIFPETANQVRALHQPEGGKETRPYDSASVSRAGGYSDQIKSAVQDSIKASFNCVLT